MKKLFAIAFSILALGVWTAGAQGILDRFTAPEKGRTVFIEKGYHALGIVGGYRSFTVGGDDFGDGYAILSYINIGNGKLQMYNASPNYSYFIANDLSICARLDYRGYNLDSDLNLGSINVLQRHMNSNTFGTSCALRKYLSFFGSDMFAVFGEAKLYGNYTRTNSCPIVDITEERSFVDPTTGETVTYDEVVRTEPDWSNKRLTHGFSTGLKIAAGACIKLRGDNLIYLFIPIAGVSYGYTWQSKLKDGDPANNAHISKFSFTRDLEYFAVQLGYTHLIKSKKRR